METQQYDKQNIDYGIRCVGEQVYGHMVKIMIVLHSDRPTECFSETLLDKVEIHQVYDQKDEYNDPGVDHEFREKGGMRPPFNPVSDRP